MTQNRTHTCNELRMEHAGQKVKLSGWMENVREVGQNFAFVILRDFYGTTQVVIETEEMMEIIHGLNKESVISVEGTVRERSSKNKNLPTGEIEVLPERIEVLGKCRYNELPFQIGRSREADETLRLKHRYLDLRNPEVKSNIVLRCNVVSAIRQAMTDHGFLEITTPILTASSPEGARDYLVPSRKHPGKFYALPQAPQQFKQLLMASGFDKYFQIAPCFRDEDARGDRSPGEFYQLDMEMSFATQDDVFAVLEDVFPPIFAKYGKYNVASAAPFRRIGYREAMETYGWTALDAVVLTHCHADHAGGLPSLLEQVPAERLLLPRLDPEGDQAPLAGAVLALAEERGLETRCAEQLLRMPLGQGTLTVYPPVAAGETNEEGLSVLCSMGDFDLLITGDMDSATEAALLETYPLPDLEVLLAGHHGSKYATSQTLLEETRPEVGIISVGPNTFGHPTAEAMGRMTGAGMDLYRTDRQGNILIRVHGEGETAHGVY